MKINRKRLNNKGFTLIELLAVVVILAVVMGIAMTSVLSSMNKSRGGALQDSAMVIARAFNQKYTEALVDGVPSDVYGDVLGTGNGYNFQSDAVYYLDKGLAKTFNISENNYAFANSSYTVNTNALIDNDNNIVDEKSVPDVNCDGIRTVDDAIINYNLLLSKKCTGINVFARNSFVIFDAAKGKFVVCLVAHKSGGYFVDSYKSSVRKNMSNMVSVESGEMYACSNGTSYSWK